MCSLVELLVATYLKTPQTVNNCKIFDGFFVIDINQVVCLTCLISDWHQYLVYTHLVLISVSLFQWNFPLSYVSHVSWLVSHLWRNNIYILLTIRITETLWFMYLDLNNIQMFQINNDMVIGKWVLQVIFNSAIL